MKATSGEWYKKYVQEYFSLLAEKYNIQNGRLESFGCFGWKFLRHGEPM